VIGLRSGGPRTAERFDARAVFRTTLHGGPLAPSQARGVIAERLAGALDAHAVETVKLLVSEAVTNCVRHARVGVEGSIDVAVAVTPSRVRAEVSTGGPAFEAPPAPAPALADEGGRGLQLIDLLSRRWGVGEHSNSVWFEVAAGEPLPGH
jgi:anti-sigma regulatory factor (Ser/Thr protein kinase)